MPPGVPRDGEDGFADGCDVSLNRLAADAGRVCACRKKKSHSVELRLNHTVTQSLCATSLV